MWTLRKISCLAGIISVSILAACSDAKDMSSDDDDDNDSAAGGSGANTVNTTGARGSGTGAAGTVDGSGGTGADVGASGSGNAQGGATTAVGGASSQGGEPVAGAAGEPGTGGEGAGPACIAVDAATSAVPAVLEFVIDKTGSFKDDAYPTDDANDASKWQEMLRVMPDSFSKLPPRWAVGSTYFSLSGATSDPAVCYSGAQASPIAELTQDHVNDLINTMPADGAGATPTFAAWRFGLQQLVDWQPPAGYEQSPRYIVLVTDGIPTVKNNGCYGDIRCEATPPDWEPATPLCAEGEVVRSNGAYAISEPEFDRFIGAIKAEGEAAGIKTYVVGVLGSQDGQGAPYDPLFKLSQIAEAGGTAAPDCISATGTMNVESALKSTLVTRGNYCHMDMTTNPDFAGGLSAALKSIVTSLVSCTYPVPKPAVDRPVDYETGTQVWYYPGGSNPNDPSTGVLLTQNKTGETDPTCPGVPGADGIPSENAGSGWYYSKYDEFAHPTELQLCPNSCALVRSDLDAQIKITFLCIDVG